MPAWGLLIPYFNTSKYFMKAYGGRPKMSFFFDSLPLSLATTPSLYSFLPWPSFSNFSIPPHYLVTF